MRLLLLFLAEFLQANLSLSCLILFKRTSSLNPHIAYYPTPELTPTQRTLLAHMITLTPGTITCEIDHEKKYLRIHILDTEDPEKTLEHITHRLKIPLYEVSQ